MATVPVDMRVVNECRAYAAGHADDAQGFHDPPTNVGLERTVARAYGIVGADQEGTPLVNVLVDRLHREKLLGRGVAYFLGRALVEGAASVQEAAETLAFASALDRSEDTGAEAARQA